MLLTLAGCHPDQDPIPPLTDAESGRDFFPIAVEQYWIYDVEDRFWNLNKDSVDRFQFRERVDTVYRNAAGEWTYRIVRSRRPDSLVSWRDDSVLAVVVSPQNVRRTFANVPVVDLIFPVREGRSWNPNQFSAIDSTTRFYRDLDRPLTARNGQSWDHTVRVVDEGEDNAYYLLTTSSVYARGIGRVLRERRQLEFCNTGEEQARLCQAGIPLPSGQYYIARGRERTEVLRAAGVR